MSNKSQLDIYVHWQFVTLATSIPNPKVTNLPLKLKDMLDDELHHPDDVSTSMTLSTLQEMLKDAVDDEKYFSTQNGHVFALSHEQFMTKSAIYGVLSNDYGEIHFESSKPAQTNKALKSISDSID